MRRMMPCKNQHHGGGHDAQDPEPLRSMDREICESPQSNGTIDPFVRHATAADVQVHETAPAHRESPRTTASPVNERPSPSTSKDAPISLCGDRVTCHCRRA